MRDAGIFWRPCSSMRPVTVPALPEITPPEQTMIDLWALGVSPDSYPTQHIRTALDALGVVPAAAHLSKKT